MKKILLATVAVVALCATAPALADTNFRQIHIDRVMLDRIGTSEDVAALALFLAADESSWVTGANFVVDGGFTAR